MSFVSMSNPTTRQTSGPLTPLRLKGRPSPISTDMTKDKTGSMALGIFASGKSSSNGSAKKSSFTTTSHTTPTKTPVNCKTTASKLPGSVIDDTDDIKIFFDPDDVGNMESTSTVMVSSQQTRKSPYLLPSPSNESLDMDHIHDMFANGQDSTNGTSNVTQVDDSTDAPLDRTPSRRDSVNSSSSSPSTAQGTPLLSSTPSAVGTLSSSPSRDVLSTVTEMLQEEPTVSPQRLDFSENSSPQTVGFFPQLSAPSESLISSPLPIPPPAKPVRVSFEGATPLFSTEAEKYLCLQNFVLKNSQLIGAAEANYLSSRNFTIQMLPWLSNRTTFPLPSSRPALRPVVRPVLDLTPMPTSPDFNKDSSSQVDQMDPSYDIELIAKLDRIKKERQTFIRAINRLDQTESQHLSVINHQRQSLLRKYKADSTVGESGPSARYQLALSYQLDNLRDVRAEFAKLRIEDLKRYPINMNGWGKTQYDRINEIWKYYDEVTKPFECRTVSIDIVVLERQAKIERKEQEEAEKDAQAEVLEFYRYKGIDIKERARQAFTNQTEKVRQVNAFYAQASELEKELQPLEKKLQDLLTSSMERAKLSKDLTKQLKPLKTQLKNLKTHIQKGLLIVQPVHPHFIILNKKLRDRNLDLISLAEYSENLVRDLDRRIEILRQPIK